MVVNLRDKQALISQLNELHSSTDWSAPDWALVTKTIKDTQQAWQRSGTVDFKVRKTVEREYSDAMTQVDAHLKDERESEVTRRQRMIAQLRKEFESDSLDQAVASAKRAQRQWKPTVQTDRKKEQALWEEFRTLCDEIFGKLKQASKETKAAWQAAAKERDALIDELDGLLKTEADPVANAAAGRANEIAKLWRQRSEIPKPVMVKMDRRFQTARKAFEQRLKRLRTTEANQHRSQLFELLNLCQNVEAALLEGADAEPWLNKVEEFDQTRGAQVKHLKKRFESALKALQGDQSAADLIRDQQPAALQARRALCLRGELVADVASPADVQADRKQLQLERLTLSLQGGGMSPEAELNEIYEQWFHLGGVSASDWQDLSQRFAAIQSK